MCGRYYIDGDAIDEAGIFTNRKYSINLNRTARDICPSQYAPILARGSDISPGDAESALQIREMRWGFPQYTGKGLFVARQTVVGANREFISAVSQPDRSSGSGKRALWPARRQAIVGLS